MMAEKRSTKKRYLFFVSLTYSYAILRPIQEAVWRRGDEAAWFIEESCPDWLVDGEKRLNTVEEVMTFNPIAVFVPGNYVYDFFPGIKVEVFHGYAMKKRIEKIDDHFRIRGWFDIYCTAGPSTTPYFKKLEAEKGFFKVYETGWPKVDPFFAQLPDLHKQRPLILYAPTFTQGISSAETLYSTIEKLIQSKPWDWIITFHPKLDDPELIRQYSALAEKYRHVVFQRSNDGLNTLRKIDAMLCDSSSITIEAMLLGKPVVTFRNTHPGKHLLDVTREEEVGQAIEKALTRPAGLMQNMHEYTLYHEAHRDGRNAERVLDAVNDFIENYLGRIKPKPLNIFRRIKLRLKVKYYRHLFGYSPRAN